MEQQFWNVFCDTGDPMSYLLCKAEEKRRAQEKREEGRKTPEQQPRPAPEASF